ncbi:uncharacterized protein LOC111199033 [Brassica napus]|uniref:uncharacterized protein LOC111199033 n=1 Tax=Brassica napus TaxID=3708 RepID=UPI002078C708|nr:uncharacterized protein LOC111199033 [Brassica napus]
MGGKRKRNTVKPNTSLVTQRPATLPAQYDFVPRDPSPSIPPVLPKNKPLPKNNPLPKKIPLPSVRDYPPPRKPFPATSFPPSQSAPSPLTPAAATSQPQQRQTQSTERMNTLPPSQPAPVRASQSPHSSEAQNFRFPEEEEDEDMSDVEAPVQPNPASDHMDLLNSLLNQPGRAKNTTVLSRNLEPGTTWFGYDKSSLSRKITKILKNKFNKPFYSWTRVPRDRQERYFLEFAKTHTWDPSLTGVRQEHFESIALLRMKDMVSEVRTSRQQPNWIGDTLWKLMTYYWDTNAAVAKSATASASRMSDRQGLGFHTHNSGQKSYMQLHQEMVVKLGRPVSFGEVFIRAHTKSDGTFSDFKAEQVIEAFKKQKEAKLATLETDDHTETGQHPPLSIEEENELFIQATFTNDRGQIYGVGSLKNQLNEVAYDPRSLSSFIQMQQKLEEAQRQIKEQAALLAKAEEDRAQAAAAAAMAEESVPEFSYSASYDR